VSFFATQRQRAAGGTLAAATTAAAENNGNTIERFVRKRRRASIVDCRTLQELKRVEWVEWCCYLFLCGEEGKRLKATATKKDTQSAARPKVTKKRHDNGVVVLAVAATVGNGQRIIGIIVSGDWRFCCFC
jgi:hypothetical protein